MGSDCIKFLSLLIVLFCSFEFPSKSLRATGWLKNDKLHKLQQIMLVLFEIYT